MRKQAKRLCDEIKADARLVARYTGREKFSERVMQAITEVARDSFVPEDLRAEAYDNRPLPIGHQQTISQPFIVALMTDLLNPQPGQRVLEIGTGSGYQAAILARLVGEVYSIERIAGLAEAAQQRLQNLGYSNVHVRCDDGNQGWPEAAPFDGIIVTAAASEIPASLTEQLAPGGRLVIPIGQRWGRQLLMLVCKDATGRLHRREILDVAFVPLLPGKQAEQ
ncbi:MAG: protein-L-isoaspartate(D-aspartate) O-methyltransferase [Gammaproteobacteria bacterium]|jgi:protein-L-isoaspartate(D-aspartate) O-methyltransferase